MSGGRFDYDQWKIGAIADEIQSCIDKNGKQKADQENSDLPFGYKRYPEDLKHVQYSAEVIECLKQAVTALRKAHVWANRVDYLLSGDDNEESFMKKLNEELKMVK